MAIVQLCWRFVVQDPRRIDPFRITRYAEPCGDSCMEESPAYLLFRECALVDSDTYVVGFHYTAQIKGNNSDLLSEKRYSGAVVK